MLLKYKKKAGLAELDPRELAAAEEVGEVRGGDDHDEGESVWVRGGGGEGEEVRA